MRTVQVWRRDRLFWFAYAKPAAKVLRWHPPKCLAMGKWKRSHVFACQYGVWTMHFTRTLFTQYQITLRDAALRDASFRLCANRLNMHDMLKYYWILITLIFVVYLSHLDCTLTRTTQNFFFLNSSRSQYVCSASSSQTS